jgi:hypothetical protein
MRTSDILKLSDDQFEKQLNEFEAIPKSRILSKTEEFELRKSLIEYEHTLNKCVDGRIVSADLQPIVNEFEAAGYNLDNLRPAVKNSLQSTYEDLKYAIENDSKSFKNSTAKLYCDLYEMFKMNKANEAITRMKNTKFFKSNKMSKESFSIESLEAFISENNGIQSTEGFLNNFFTKLIHKSQIPAASYSIQAGILLVSILLLLITIAVITLCVINAQYKAELVKILNKLSDDDVKNKGGALKCRQENVKAAALNMDINTPSFTKQTLIKAAKYSIRQINGFSKADYSELDKSVEEFNAYCNEVANSNEDWVEDSVKKLYGKFIEFVTKWKTGIIAVGMIIGFVKIGIPLIRASIYHFKSWRIKMSDFFSEQTEITTANIEYLIEQRDDPATSPMEKERLSKIIQRQRVWVKNMSAWANLFYKSEVDAGSDTMYEIRQDEKIDFDEIARKQEREEEASIDEMNGNVPEEDVSSPTKPVVLF